MRSSRFTVAAVVLAAVMTVLVPTGSAQAAYVRAADEYPESGVSSYIDASRVAVWNRRDGVIARVIIPEFRRGKYWQIVVQIERASDGAQFVAHAKRRADGTFRKRFSYTLVADDGEYTFRSCPFKHVVTTTSVTVTVPAKCFARRGTIRVNMIPRAYDLPGGFTNEDYAPNGYWTPSVRKG